MGNLRIYTADDEDPRCSSCDYVCDSDKWYMENCGAENGWTRYKRTELEEEG